MSELERLAGEWSQRAWKAGELAAREAASGNDLRALFHDGRGEALRQVAAELRALAGAGGWTERELQVMRFALNRFAWDARNRADEAGQAKDGEGDAVGLFLADAKDAEALLARIITTPPAVAG